MYRTSNAFSVLQAIAAIASIAIILWSLGLPSFHFVEAASLTSVSDTLSTSEPSVVANHTIQFTTPTGVAAGETIVITFPDGASDFDLSTIGAEDIDLASTTGDYSLSNAGPSGETWGVATTTFSITFTSGSAVLDANATVTIKIGTNATFEAVSPSQIVNPAVAGGGDSYEITISAGDGADTGATRVAIVDKVTVTASVDTVLNFSVTGVQGNQTVNGTTTGATSTATLIPFGVLQSGTASTAAQDLTVVTNARNGFVVTVVSDGQLDSQTGAVIDSFADGGNQSTPVAWSAPSGDVALDNTWGHWGITSDDTDIFAATQTYVAASTTPVTVFTHDGPVDGINDPSTGTSTTRVGYSVQITDLQEAATDYQAVLTYIATPTF